MAKPMKLCLPAMIYLAISGLMVVCGIFLNVGSLLLIVKVAFISLWTFLLNWLCSKGYSSLSWIILLFPVIMVTLMVLVNKNSIKFDSFNIEGFKEGVDDKGTDDEIIGMSMAEIIEIGKFDEDIQKNLRSVYKEIISKHYDNYLKKAKKIISKNMFILFVLFPKKDGKYITKPNFVAARNEINKSISSILKKDFNKMPPLAQFAIATIILRSQDESGNLFPYD